MIDAIVLAGGRSSRLTTVNKAHVVVDGETLLNRTLAAVSFARRVVVVGLISPDEVPRGVRVTREEPRYGGPTAAISEGLRHIGSSDTPDDHHVIVLACDMPKIADAVATLHGALRANPLGVIAVDEGHRQPLAAIFRRSDLTALTVAARATFPGGVDGMSVSRLIAPLRLTEVVVPAGSTRDIDTWADAAFFGVPQPISLRADTEAGIKTEPKSPFPEEI
ncbi:MAG: molybdenum cofactor guanylyltransferase [Microbacteriaceae bacterium]|nr:molybdenum cofactor guanylyltransferase [Microbacteriaceae bacterium]